MENIADFVSAYVIGNLLQMAFRFWAFRRWVFPDEFARNPDKARGGVDYRGRHRRGLEDEIEGATPVAPCCARGADAARGRSGQLGDSSDPRVSKTS